MSSEASNSQGPGLNATKYRHMKAKLSNVEAFADTFGIKNNDNINTINTENEFCYCFCLFIMYKIVESYIYIITRAHENADDPSPQLLHQGSRATRLAGSMHASRVSLQIVRGHLAGLERAHDPSPRSAPKCLPVRRAAKALRAATAAIGGQRPVAPRTKPGMAVCGSSAFGHATPRST